MSKGHGVRPLSVTAKEFAIRHAHTFEAAKKTPGAFAQLLTVDDTRAIASEVLAKELQGYINEYGREEGEAFYRQEYHCDFNAAVMGAILGRYVERAERDGRINDVVGYDPDGGVQYRLADSENSDRGLAYDEELDPWPEDGRQGLA